MNLKFYKFCLLILLISYQNHLARANEQETEEVYSSENQSTYDDCNIEDGEG